VQRTVIVGDIHGCFDELLELFEKSISARTTCWSASAIWSTAVRRPVPWSGFRDRPNSVVSRATMNASTYAGSSPTRSRSRASS
jgi:serine/threonine protein phosphatase 1